MWTVVCIPKMKKGKNILFISFEDWDFCTGLETKDKKRRENEKINYFAYEIVLWNFWKCLNWNLWWCWRFYPNYNILYYIYVWWFWSKRKPISWVNFMQNFATDRINSFISKSALSMPNRKAIQILFMWNIPFIHFTSPSGETFSFFFN